MGGGRWDPRSSEPNSSTPPPKSPEFTQPATTPFELDPPPPKSPNSVIGDRMCLPTCFVLCLCCCCFALMNTHQSYVFLVIHVVGGGVCCCSSYSGSEEMKKVYVRRKWRRWIWGHIGNFVNISGVFWSVHMK